MKKTKEIDVKKLLKKFNPEEDAVDRRIYYGVTNKKIDPNDKFSDKSDDNMPRHIMMSASQKSMEDSLRSTSDPG